MRLYTSFPLTQSLKGFGQLFFVWLLLCILFPGCQPAEQQGTTTNSAATAVYRQEVQTSMQHTQAFAVEYRADYKMLSLFSGSDTTRYLLLLKGAAVPENVAFDQQINLPVQKVITQSTTHIGMIAFAEAEEIIAGVDVAAFVYNPRVSAQIAAGAVQEVGGGESLNTEMVMAMQPDLLMVSGMPGVTSERYQALIQTGIPVLINTEWMEKTPLARAEWVKLLAVLTNKEALVNRKFAEVENTYDSLSRLTAGITGKPKVLWSFPYQDTWYTPGGQSYPSHLLQQAAGAWPWPADTATAGTPASFEAMYAYGQEADFWINPGDISSKQDMLERDARFASFKPFRENTIFNNIKRMNASGQGNDYYESGVVQPQLLLADLIKMLHPELLPDHTLYYYQQLQ